MASERWLRITMGLVLAAAAAYLLYRLRFVLITIALAAMLAYALLPLVDWVGRLRVGRRSLPRFAAVTLVFVLVALVVAAVVHVAAAPVAAEAQRFSQNMAQYRDKAGALLNEARTSIAGSLPPPARQRLDEAIGRAEGLLFNALASAIQATARWLSHVVELILIPILAFYFLVDLPVLKHEFTSFLPARLRGPTLLAARRADRIVAGYVRGQVILMALSGVVVWIGLALIGVRFPLLLGIVAGLTRAIPIIGPVVGAIPIVGVAFLQSPDAAAIVLTFFIVLQLVESKIILPQVIGHELRLHAATILLALLIGNALFGLMGMFLAAPAAAFLREMRELAEAELAAPVAAGSARER